MFSKANDGKVLKRANPSTIQNKFMVGYQGWFTCAGDGEPISSGHHGWLHWFNSPIPDGGRPNTDLWPDVSEYSPSELYPVPGLNLPSGEQAKLFSSRHPKTVQRHFNWMAQHGVDGAFLQRFAGQCDLESGNEGIRKQRDEIGDRVKEAAEKEGRVFAIMYDVSGVAPDKIQCVLERDWIHLVCEKGVLNSPNYLRENGKPVISLWGFGFENSNHTPASIRAIVSFFRFLTPGGAYIIAGAPAHWRTGQADADRNPEFLDVWLNEFDAISPWTVGRYGNEDDVDRFTEEMTKPDFELLKKRAEQGQKKVNYLPVVLPGGSGFNLSEGKWGFNGIKRNGGKFLWKQIHNARRLGIRVMYGAMWDEYDEGTAFMPVVQTKRQVPVSDKFHFMALDEDGFDLPSDWYMRICGFAAEALHSERMIHETFPSKELQDYWSTRPHYEDQANVTTSGPGSAGAGGSAADEEQKYKDWLKTQKDGKDGPPPPPYSLEAAEGRPAVVPQSAMSSAPERTSSPVPIAAAATPQVQPGQTQYPSVASQGPPVASRPQPEATNTFPSPGSFVHSAAVNTLADNFIRQSSLSSPPVNPTHYSPQAPQQPYSSMGSLGSTAPGGPPVAGPRPSASPTSSVAGSYSGPGMPPHSFRTMPSVQSPSSQQQHSPYGPTAHPGEEGYFGNVSQPQPHQQYSYGHSPGGPQQPGQQSQQYQQYSHGPSSGPPSGPQAQWPPTHWNSGNQPPQSPHSPSSYPGGFTPLVHAGHHPSQSPGPSPPGPYGGAPPNRPPGMPQPQYQHPPQQQQAYHSNSGHSFPIASDALNLAFNAVGSVAGDDRRRKLEQGVGKLTQSGAKLYHKFSK